jgi:hypothetical protein
LTRFPQKTVCTAPTAPQLFDALAAETKAWFKKLPLTLQDLFEIQVEQIRLKAAPEESFIAFRTSKAETPEAMAGVHSDNVKLIADEASGVPDAVYEAGSGSMSGDNATTILAGNPVRTAGLFHDSHRDLSHKWLTFHIPCIYPDGRLHPRITQDFIDDMKDRYGEDSNAYRVRVLGEFPTAEDDVVIPFELIEAAYLRDVRALQVRPVWGLDVAYTGNDRSALCKRQGNVVTEQIRIWKGLDTMQLSGVVHNEWKDTPASERPEEILVDAIGFGAGVADRLREMGLPARGVMVSELPALKARYARLRDELYFLARGWFDARDCRLGSDNKELGRELGVVHYLPPDSSGKVRVESTEKIKKNLRGASPDLASAFILTFASGAATALYGTKNATSWTKPLLRKIAGIV